MSDAVSRKSETPLVSVYCMTYNQEKTIGQAIESIVAQKTDFPFELIVHDDASTDKTAEIVRDYAARYPDIVRPIFQTENQFRNCNLIQTFIHPVSRGQYIAICEGDDYWTDPEKLQLQVERMESVPACTLCFHAVRQLHADGSMMNYRPLKEDCAVPTEMVIKRGGLFCPTVSLMFRRDVMDEWPAFRTQADVYDYPAQVLAATFFLAITVSGFFKRDMTWWERAVTFAAAILLMTPEVITSIIGIALGVGVLLLDVIMGKTNKPKTA